MLPHQFACRGRQDQYPHGINVGPKQTKEGRELAAAEPLSQIPSMRSMEARNHLFTCREYRWEVKYNIPSGIKDTSRTYLNRQGIYYLNVQQTTRQHSNKRCYTSHIILLSALVKNFETNVSDPFAVFRHSFSRSRKKFVQNKLKQK